MPVSDWEEYDQLSIVRELLALLEAYRVLIADTDFRAYCDDHDLAQDRWAEIDRLQQRLGTP